MTREIVELAGIFLTIVGFGVIVAAAALVSTALALLAAGVFAVFLGIVVIMGANRAPKAGPS